MSPTRRQLIAGLFASVTAAAIPIELEAAPITVQPAHGVLAMIRDRQECNRFIDLEQDGRLRATILSESDAYHFIEPNERLTSAEFIDRMMNGLAS